MPTLSRGSSGQSTGDNRSYECSAGCGKRFTMPKNQQRRERRSCKLGSQQNKLPVWCICGRTCVRTDALRDHMFKEHSGLNGRFDAVYRELVGDWRAAQDFIDTFPHESGTAPAIKEQYRKSVRQAIIDEGEDWRE